MKPFDAIVLNSQALHVGRVVHRWSCWVSVVDARGVVRFSHARFLLKVWR